MAFPLSVRLLEALRRFVDPAGPIGEVASPSDVYKSRIGLPIEAPHRQRVTLEAPKFAAEAVALAPTRFVAQSTNPDVPRDRVRQVSAFVEEVWQPQYAATHSTDMVEILRASQTLLGWWVRQRVAESARARLTAEQFAEVLQSVQIQATDAYLCGYYTTIKGNDPIVVDGKTLTGGTRITSRTHYREATKGYVHWSDKGFLEKRQAALAEEASRPIRNVRANLERVAGEVLPLHRKIANPRYDRRSAV